MSQVRMSSVSRVTAAGVLALALSFPALAQNVSLVSASAVTDGGILPANVLQRPANLRVHDVPLAAALLELRHSSGVALAYSPSLFPADRRVSCLCEARTVREALAHLLQGTEFRYSELGRMVLIEPKAALAGGGAAGSDLMLVLTSAVVKADEPAGSASRLEPRALPQEATIRGVVTDQRTGQPLEGAQVHFPRLALGTLTDNAGRFALSRVPAGQYELRAEYLGYASASQTVSITPGGALTVNFQLASSAIGLDEIVVTGTPGATQRRQLGVAVDQIRTSEFLETAPVVSVSDLLSNRAAGVFIMSQGGQVGVGSIPKLRGTGSISLSNSPIIYVDGVRIDRTEITGPGGGSGPSRFDDIRPEDIESIEIIKGPAASTLYGTEASNGVIQIITKQGRPGQRAQITVSTEHGVNWFKNPQGEFPPNYYRAPDGTVLIQDLYDEEKAAGRDVFRDGYHQSYNVGIRGGATGLGYYLSADYEDKDGVLPNNGLKRFSARGNVNAQVRDNLDITSSMGFITADWTRAPEGGSVNLGQLTGLLWGSPRDKNTPLRGFLRAPPEESAKIQIGQEAEHFTWSVKGEHRLFGWLTHRLTVGTDIVSERNFRLWPRQIEGTRHFFAARGLGEKFVQNVIRQNNTLDYAATANFSLRPDLTSTTSFGVQYYARKENLTQALGEIFPAPGLETVSAGSRRSGDESFLENKTFGLFIQQQFGWKNRVFLTAALRADDNSAFGKEVDPAYYPKVSGVWVLSEEPFWNVGSWLNEFRIRGAWGAAGQQPDAYASVRTFEPVAGPGGTSALNPGKPGNPKLKPEKGEELEVGFDAGLFGGRVGLDFTYYSNSTKDAIVLKDVAPSEGWGGVQFVNIGEIRNWGFEVGLNARLVEMGALSWEVNGKLAHSKDEIVSLGGIPPINTGAGRRQVWHIEGYPVGGFWNKKIVSAQRGADGRMTNILCDGGAANNHQPMSCDEAPDIFIGGPGPYWDAVVTNALNVGKLRITALLDMKLDQRKLNVQRYASDYIFFNSERINVPEKTDPLFLAAVQLNNLGPIVERIDWIRLREIGASYTLPEAWARRFFGATSLVVTASGRNLWDIWDHPESTFVGGEEEIQTDTRSWVRETQTIIAPQALFLTGFRVTF